MFSARGAAWLERGGLLAMANLRGGGEYGKAWHEAGRLDRKQNVFDDFCGCARWLTASGWSARNAPQSWAAPTRPARRRVPDPAAGLFGACVAEVGVFDMLRFHKFTIGWAWTSELGDPGDPEQYRWLRAYSPLHNVRPAPTTRRPCC